MKDNFSKQAPQYASFRPHYPDELIACILSFVKCKEVALDVATGNGQVAHKLSGYFNKVYATDISDKQLANAHKANNIIYKNEPAEKTSFGDNVFDLITVAQAVHWLEFDEFYNEVYRILKPDGIFAVLGYGLFSTNENSDEILNHYYNRIVGPYWDEERKYLDGNYLTIPFPFIEIQTPKFTNTTKWDFKHLIGYLNTWSATQHYKSKKATDPVALIYNELKISWERGDKSVAFPMLLRIGKMRNQ